MNKATDWPVMVFMSVFFVLSLLLGWGSLNLPGTTEWTPQGSFITGLFAVTSFSLGCMLLAMSRGYVKLAIAFFISFFLSFLGAFWYSITVYLSIHQL
jgi:hypothetical protein